MKNQRVFVCVLTLLPLLISLGSHAHAQADRNPEKDLAATAKSSLDFRVWEATGGTQVYLVYGTLTNTSANAYPCVRILTELHARRQVILGTFPVYLQNIKPHESLDFQEQLPPSLQVERVQVKGISECPFNDHPNNIPHVVFFRATPGRVRRGHTVKLEWLTVNTDTVLLRHNDSSPGSRARRVNHSGSTHVRARQTGTYYLEAKKGANSAVPGVTIEVIP
jgi:hypothetical protein